jgi:diazepam-binding inhibitor (GABA receptor modulating acyl-CoA-binding protein)
MDVTELAMLLETMEPGDVSESEFQNACQISKGLKDLQDDQRLQLYGLFKQSTIGDNNTAQPFIWDLVGRAKWDAWTNYRGMQ